MDILIQEYPPWHSYAGAFSPFQIMSDLFTNSGASPEKQAFAYQIKLIEDTRRGLFKHQHIIMQLPTGGGKSFCFVQIAKIASQKGRTVLILSESLKIYKQIKDEFNHVHEIADGVKFVQVQYGHIYQAMTQTLRNRPFILAQFQKIGQGCIVITDEAHYGTHTKVLKLLRDCYTIGVTATPNMKDAKFLPELYNHLVKGPSIQELQEHQPQRLCTYRHFERQVVDKSKLKISGGEYTEESQEQAFSERVVYDGLLEDLTKFHYKHCMIFVASQKHAQATYEALQAAGFICVQYHTGIAEHQRSFNLGQFTAGQIPICISVGALVKGWDFQELDLVILLRATNSRSLYIQMVGRASRAIGEKKEFLCLDYGGNGTRHFGWDYDHDWEKMWNQVPKKRKEGATPSKTCPKCDYMMNASQMVCPNCGHIFEVKPKDVPPTELVELDKDFQSLRGRSLSSLSPQELAIYAKKTGKKGHSIRVARRGEQLTPGFLREFARAMSYKPAWVGYQMAEMGDKPIEFYDKTIS